MSIRSFNRRHVMSNPPDQNPHVSRPTHLSRPVEPSSQSVSINENEIATPHYAHITLNVNGTHHELEVDMRTTLLDALREHLKLTGTKKGCDHGQCGACTVIANGRRINACLTLAVMQQEAEITTIEGLGKPDNLHPLQSAFIRHDGYQCGYCTPGQICSSVAMLSEIEAGVPSHVTQDLVSPSEVNEAELRERMSGNICRCGAYANIIAALQEYAGRKGS